MAYFIKIPKHSNFERGIFIPFRTLEEAQMQMANDLLSTDFIEGIVKAPYSMDHEGGFPRHVFTNDHVASVGDIKKLQTALLDKAAKQAGDAQTELVLKVSRLKEGLSEHGSFQNLPAELKDLARQFGMEPMAVAGRPGFTVVSGGTATGGAIALAAATAKTVIGVAAGAVGAPAVCEFAISFDGVTQSAVPVLCETVSGTNATNPPGTASTSMTPKQIRGWSVGAASSTAAYNWTTEPTVLEVFKKRLLTPAGGLIVIQFPLDREPLGLVTASTQFKFVGLRLTAPAIVNVHTDLEFDE